MGDWKVIYQARLRTADEGKWDDCYAATFYALQAHPDKYETRIAYTTGAGADALNQKFTPEELAQIITNLLTNPDAG